MTSLSLTLVLTMALGFFHQSGALQTSKGEEKLACGGWCKKSQCSWKACRGCDICGTPTPAPPPAAADCEGNCAAGGVVTSSEGAIAAACGVNTGGPYDPVNCPMKYLGWAPKSKYEAFCDGDLPWVELDLGAATAFNTIEIVQPQRKSLKPPGYCGLAVWVDGASVYTEPGYTAKPEYDKSGKYQVTTVTGTFTGQKIKVQYGRSAKNPTAHLFGINVYKK